MIVINSWTQSQRGIGMNFILLTGGTIIDTKSRQFYRGDILIKDGIIEEVSAVPIQPLPDASVVDLSGKFVSPGFMDSHIHIESSMLSPLEFAHHAIKHGTTALLVDPHEIANVFGIRAVELFMELADILPLDMFIGIPSCVPATYMEQSGSVITRDEIISLLPDRRIYGLAEMMNFPGVINGFGDAREKVDAVYDFGKIVDGHCPGVSGNDLIAYITNGRMDGTVRIMNDHETTKPGEAAEKIHAGMYLALRYGSAVKDMDAILPQLLNSGADPGRCMLCSDDLSAQELFEAGHVDRIIRRAREIIMTEKKPGMEEATMEAIIMATQNPGRYLSRFLSYHKMPPMGEIAPGYRANLTILESLDSLRVTDVLHGGRFVLRNGTPTADPAPFDFSPFIKSMNLPEPLTEKDFVIDYEGSHDSVQVKVIDVMPGSLFTGTHHALLPVRDGSISPDAEHDIAMIAVFERHHATGARSLGFVRGLGISSGAIASTIAHDSHNLIIAGYDASDMARVGNHLAQQGGGIALLHDGKLLHLPLEIGGLMSRENIASVIKRYGLLKEEARLMGTRLKNVFMAMSFLSLPVIPELKITDQGLVDVTKFEFTMLYEK